MLIGVDGADGGAMVELGLRSFRALGTRVGSATVWLVADVEELTVGAATTATVEVLASGCWLELLGTWWLRGGGSGCEVLQAGERESRPLGGERTGKA